MATRWMDNIRNTGRLTIFPGGSITAGGWRTTFTGMIAEWNRQASAGNFGVTFAAATAAPGAASGGADVQMEAVNGPFNFAISGVTLSGNLAGSGVSAVTKLLIREFTQRPPGGGPPATVRRIENALIVVPAAPRATTPNRPLGNGVKLCIGVHEMVHAAGLSDADHGQNDIFFGFPQLRTGSTPARDGISPDTDPKSPVMPPIVFSAQTAARIRANWA